MKTWQRYWLYFVVIIFSLHFIRDVFQAFGIKNFLSTFLESSGLPKAPLFIYYTIYNTWVIALTEIVFALICLRQNKFERLGNLTIIIAILSLLLWLIYYFIL